MQCFSIEMLSNAMWRLRQLIIMSKMLEALKIVPMWKRNFSAFIFFVAQKCEPRNCDVFSMCNLELICHSYSFRCQQQAYIRFSTYLTHTHTFVYIQNYSRVHRCFSLLFNEMMENGCCCVCLYVNHICVCRAISNVSK